MRTNNRSISIYPGFSFNIVAEANKQMENMVKQYSQAVTFALNLPILEMVNSMKIAQQSFARNLQLALNPLAAQTQPAVDVQKVEIVVSDHLIFGFSISVDGMFSFEGTLIKTISTNSKQGRFLKILLTHEDNYVSDELSIKKLDIPDKDKGIGYVRRDLKRDLLKSGIEINLRRHTKKGYRLLGARKLPH